MISSRTASGLLRASSDVDGKEESEVEAEDEDENEARRSMIEFSISFCCCGWLGVEFCMMMTGSI